MIKRTALKSNLAIAAAIVSLGACNTSKTTMADAKTDNSVVTVVEQPRQPNRVPATPYPIKYVQPSGDTLTIRLHGDERHHWAETIDGYLILQKKDGTYDYAYRNAESKLISLEIVAQDAEKRDAATVKAIEKAKVR